MVDRPHAKTRVADVCDRVAGIGGDGLVNAFVCARSRCGDFAVGVCGSLKACRGNTEGEGDAAAPEGGGCVGFGDVYEDTGANAVFVVGCGVFVDGELLGGARVEELC